MVNRYEVFADGGEGRPGPIVAFAEQRRTALKEQVTFYTDQSKQHTLAVFKARKVIDLASAYDVITPDGQQVGVVGKKFGRSLFRSTWQLDQPGQGQVTLTSSPSLRAAIPTATEPSWAPWRRKPSSGTTTCSTSRTRHWIVA